MREVGSARENLLGCEVFFWKKKKRKKPSLECTRIYTSVYNALLFNFLAVGVIGVFMRAWALTCMRVSVPACARAYSSRVKCHSRGGKIARWTVREFFYDRFLRFPRSVCSVPSLSPADPGGILRSAYPGIMQVQHSLRRRNPTRAAYGCIAVRLSFSRSACIWRIWCSRYDTYPNYVSYACECFTTSSFFFRPA